MDQEFVTSAGKIILNNKRVLIRNIRFSFWSTAAGEMFIPACTLIIAFFSFLNPVKPFGYFATIILIALFFSNSFKQFYTVLIKKSYSNYISLHQIQSFELKPDEFGLETEVRLHLKTGRYRSIVFRTHENQYQPFTENLSQYIAQPQFV